ncbi:hypothetical protein GGR09_001660, partial [Bartonella heixiaziensis]
YVTGAYHGRSRNRYHRFKLRIPKNEPWTMITAIFSPRGCCWQPVYD